MRRYSVVVIVDDFRHRWDGGRIDGADVAASDHTRDDVAD